MNQTSINLIKQKNDGALGRIGEYEPKIQLAAIISILVLLVVGVILGATFFFARSQGTQLTRQKSEFTGRIAAASAKEGIIISLKQRIGVAQKALDAARPWGRLFPLIDQIAPTQQFVSLTIDESGRVNTILEASSIDDAVAIVSHTMELTQSRAMRNPQLLSFALRDTGVVQIGLSFIPIF